MKIVVTGGGSGGHFYPILAVVHEIRSIAKERKILEPKIYFISTDPYNPRALFESNIVFKRVMAGKRRTYTSARNFFDLFVTGMGVMQALWQLFWIFPDVVFGKGGYASFPTLLAARILGIPVVIHESDSAPGRVNAWAAGFAKSIALSYPDVAELLPVKARAKVAVTGNPVRIEVQNPIHEGANEYLELDPTIPTILVLGGSQGALLINDLILDALPRLVQHYQIVHQTGKANFKQVATTADVAVSDPILRRRYKPFDYLNDLGMRMAAGASSLVISRAGSSLFEIASWGIPAIIIPITESNGDHQRKNAFNYARAGAGTVIEENNISDDILLNEIDRMMSSPTQRAAMSNAAKKFFKADAGRRIAHEIVAIALDHEV